MKTEVKKSVKVARGFALTIIAGVVLLVALTPADDKPKKPSKSEVKPFHAWVAAKELVKAKLTSPATADFPAADDRHDNVNDTTFWIEGHVDSQNAYGAVLRTSFQIKVVYTGGDPMRASSWRELEFRQL